MRPVSGTRTVVGMVSPFARGVLERTATMRGAAIGAAMWERHDFFVAFAVASSIRHIFALSFLPQAS
jgi:hypothetical protein